MIVKVSPIFPIPCILPKNKFIDDEMILDLNDKEIRHCMNYGVVYDENGIIIDNYYLNKRKFATKSILNVPKPVCLESENLVESNILDIVKEHTEINEKIVNPEYDIAINSITKDNNFIIIETVFTSNTELTGDMYGLFEINPYTKHSLVEYKSGENWIKFGKKFGDFKELYNGDKFIFRINSNSKDVTFNLCIKEKNKYIVKLTGNVSVDEL